MNEKICKFCVHWNEQCCTLTPVWIETKAEHYCGQFLRETSSIFDENIISEEMTTHLRNCLRCHNVITINDLLNLKCSELATTPNMGEKAFDELTSLLKKKKIIFSMKKMQSSYHCTVKDICIFEGRNLNE